MADSFKDHFSGHAPLYARYRPHYPKELFKYLAGLAGEHDLAWDCATGSGQAALDLVPYFKEVVASDASREQIQQAVPHEKITYRVDKAEESALPNHSVDLLTIANALHWFDLEPFYGEARRVLKPQGVIAAWCYADIVLPSPEHDKVVRRYYHDLVGPFWPPERKLVEGRYETIPFPFVEIKSPPFAMQTEWTMDHFIGFLSTWSATQRYMAEKGKNPLDQVRDELGKAWGNPQEKQKISWPLHLRVGRPA